jgi:hypothetical protein
MRPVKYELNGEFGIYVEDRGRGKWAVTHMGRCMDAGGDWDYEPSPSNRTDEWVAQHRFDSPEEAQAAFLLHKHRLVINGRAL